MATLSGNDPTTIDKEKSYTPGSERETEVSQKDASSATLADPEVDASQVKSLPGVGGADDAGDIEVDDEAIRESIARRNGSIPS